MDVFGVAVTFCLHRLYLKENFRRSFEKFDTEPLRRKSHSEGKKYIAY